MQILRSANEAHGSHTKTPSVEAFFGGSEDLRMIRQAKIIVRAQIEHLTTVLQLDPRILGAGDDAFGLIETRLAKAVDLTRKIVFEIVVHTAIE